MNRFIFILCTIFALLAQPVLALECAAGDCHEQERASVVESRDQHNSHEGEAHKNAADEHCVACSHFSSAVDFDGGPGFYHAIVQRELISSKLASFYRPPFLKHSLRPPLAL